MSRACHRMQPLSLERRFRRRHGLAHFYAVRLLNALTGARIVRFDMLALATVRDLLVEAQQYASPGALGADVLFPDFRHRDVEDLLLRFPDRRASLRPSESTDVHSVILRGTALATRLFELGASEVIEREDVIVVSLVSLSAVQDVAEDR